MRYLYGDASPFPLDENFIDTLVAAVDACVALFRADQEVNARKEKVANIEKYTRQEQEYLDALARSVEKALAPFMPEDASNHVAYSTATQITQHARAIIADAGNRLKRQGDSAVSTTMGRDIAERVFEAVAVFLRKHQLPESTWQYNWSYDLAKSSAEMILKSSSSCGLFAEYQTRLTAGQRWGQPPRLLDILPSAHIRIPRAGNWLKRLMMGAHEDLGFFSVTQVAIRSQQVTLEVRRQVQPDAGGYRILIRTGKDRSPLIFPLGGDSDEPLPIYGDDAEHLASLCQLINSDFDTLKGQRDIMTSARIGARDIKSVDEPADVATLIISALTPIIREMRLRSRVPGELVLKRDLGQGRREELFVPRQTLIEKFADLPAAYRSQFHSAGLGSEGTVEFVTLMPATESGDKSTRRFAARESKTTATSRQSPSTSSPTDVAA